VAFRAGIRLDVTGLARRVRAFACTVQGEKPGWGLILGIVASDAARRAVAADINLSACSACICGSICVGGSAQAKQEMQPQMHANAHRWGVPCRLTACTPEHG
jgi:hypothetical protein